MHKLFDSSKSHKGSSMKEGVSMSSGDQTRSGQSDRSPKDTRERSASFSGSGYQYETRAQRNIRRDSLRAREDLNDFNVDSSL